MFHPAKEIGLEYGIQNYDLRLHYQNWLIQINRKTYLGVHSRQKIEIKDRVV